MGGGRGTDSGQLGAAIGKRARPTREASDDGASDRNEIGRRRDPAPCPRPSRASVRTDRRVRSEFEVPIRGVTGRLPSGSVARAGG